MRRHLLIVALALAVPLASANAEAEDLEPLASFFPLLTRRPVFERLLELHVEHAKEPAGRQTTSGLGLELPLLPRWKVGLDGGLVFADPRDRGSQEGLGDTVIENTVLLFAPRDRRSLVAAGVAVTFPTGSERRGLGGETGIEPFVTAGLVRNGWYIVGEIARHWNLSGPGADQLQSGVAVGYAVHPLLIPLLELRTTTDLRGTMETHRPPLRDRTFLALIPGFDVEVRPSVSVGLGVEIPVTRARTTDYTLRGSVSWSF